MRFDNFWEEAGYDDILPPCSNRVPMISEFLRKNSVRGLSKRYPVSRIDYEKETLMEKM